MTDYPALVPLYSQKPFIQFIVSMLVMLILAIAGVLITLLSAWAVFGIAPGELSAGQIDTSARALSYFKYLQTFQHVSVFLLPSLVIGYLMRGNTWSYFGFGNYPGMLMIVLCMLFIILLIPLNSYMAWLNSGLELPGWLDGIEKWMIRHETEAEDMTRAMINAKTAGGLIINLFIIAILPAIGEELLFRGVLQRIFTGWTGSGVIAVILTALIFSATHLQFYGFIPRFILGLAFGFMFLWTGNIWMAVTAHLVNNAIPVVLSYAAGWDNINSTFEEFSASDGFAVIITTALAMIIAFYIRKISREAQDD